MNAVTNVTETAVALPAPASLMDALIRAASDPNVDVDKLERLGAIVERINAQQAAVAFDEAMNLAQLEMRPIAADAHNPQTKSKYASYAALDRALRPIYAVHGFSLSFNTADGAAPDHVRVVCRVARAGHNELHHLDMPCDGKGAKGGDVMTKTHATGAANTYGKRYLLGDIFNVVIGPDTDGNEGMPETAIAEWITKINATTTKDKAKEVWAEGIKAAKAAKDSYAAKKLRDALVTHGEFIDKAGR